MTTATTVGEARGPRGTGDPAGPLRLDARTLDLALCEVAAFLAVVHCGGFTVAARSMHVSQPGLSARVQRLERALGVVVIDRSVRRLTLTPHGRAFLPVAERVVRELAEVSTSLRDLPDAGARTDVGGS